MTFSELNKKGLKKLFLKNENEIECEKWELIGRFVLSSKHKGNFKDIRGIDMYIYYYDETHCFIETYCTKNMFHKSIDMTTKEIVEYENFFNHIFDVDEYIIRE